MAKPARQTCILVVDDEPVIRNLMQRVLSLSGFVAIAAGPAAEALDLLTEAEADMLVTDLRMPVMDGLELARQVRLKLPRIPVLLVSGYALEAVEGCGHSYLEKPFSAAQLVSKVRQTLAAD